jgi:protoheme IX farnesyltransferase
MYREDYAGAGLVMLPDLSPSGEDTGRKAVMNSFALLVASLLPTFLGLTGIVYALVALALGSGLLVMSWLFFRERSLKRARGLFLASVIYMPMLVIMMVLSKVVL